MSASKILWKNCFQIITEWVAILFFSQILSFLFPSLCNQPETKEKCFELKKNMSQIYFALDFLALSHLSSRNRRVIFMGTFSRGRITADVVI